MPTTKDVFLRRKDQSFCSHDGYGTIFTGWSLSKMWKQGVEATGGSKKMWTQDVEAKARHGKQDVEAKARHGKQDVEA